MAARLYDGPIIDAHHHLWDGATGAYSWLHKSASTMPIEGFASLPRAYQVQDYLRDCSGQNLVASVHVEAKWDLTPPTDETRWLDSLDKGCGVATRYVVAARLGTSEAEEYIQAQASHPGTVAVRATLSHHPLRPDLSFIDQPDLGLDPAWRRDVATVRDAGLHLELLAYPHQATIIGQLARDFPDLVIVINHCASPIDRDETGLALWRDALQSMAQHQNIELKISNLAAYDRLWSRGSLSDGIATCLAAFGIGRCMFGSDFPISKLNMSAAEVFETMRMAVANLAEPDQRALFHDNARRRYRF